MRNTYIKKIIFSLGIFFAFSFALKADAAVLLPGNISSCGELAAPGTYTLTQNVSGGTDTCFTISSDNVVLNGGGFTISGSGAVAIDARARTGGPSGSLAEGAHAYTNLVLNDLNISGYTTGLNISGNADTTGSGQNNGNGGDAGDVAIFYSYIGSIIADGGQTTAESYGGVGGNIAFTDTNLNIASSTLSAKGGVGTSGNRGSDGGLDLNYSGTLTRTNLTLSALAYLNDNTTEYTSYVGGTWPITNTSLSTCGTLYATTTTTFTLTQDLTSSGTCFYINGDNITIDGAGYTITHTSSSTDFAVQATENNYSTFTVKDLDFVEYANTINSDPSLVLRFNSTLDLSEEHIEASTLIVESLGSLIYTDASVAISTELTINNYEIGPYTGNLSLLYNTGIWTEQTDSSTAQWSSITSSADGTKLAAVLAGGYIYTSTDSGITWTQQTGAGIANWNSITSSADGTKLAATNGSGYIYTSTDGGVTWIERKYIAGVNWTTITSSADGTKLAAAAQSGYIYTSTDGGLNWVAQTNAGGQSWTSITSSADGNKLVVVSSSDYTPLASTDGGVTWTSYPNIGVQGNNVSITSSADGTKLALVSAGGYINISTDGGANWTEQTSVGAKNWSSITSSADGMKLAAANGSGYIYISTDGGTTWAEQTSAGARSWTTITSSADGTKLAASGLYEYIYTFFSLPQQTNIIPISPIASSTVATWNPFVIWSNTADCYYSYDNWVSTSTANCALKGSDISAPISNGAQTLYLKAFGNGNVTEKILEFISSYIPQDTDIDIQSPESNIRYLNSNWSPVVDYDITNLNTLTYCAYSYDNFSTEIEVDCSEGGTDILPPETQGNSTLYIKTIDDDLQEDVNSISFIYDFIWVVQESGNYSGYWKAITSSTDGMNLAAYNENTGYIYTSTDGGVTWIEQTSAGARNWTSITSSADGTKLAAVAQYEYVYTSTDGGVTWTEQTSAGAKEWMSIISSADGTKLAAAAAVDKIYTSADGGVTWTEQNIISCGWSSITSSADGTKLAAACDQGGEGIIYTSTDSGVTWTEQSSAGFRSWRDITSSADGMKLAAVDGSYGYVYTSTDGGVTWTERGSSGARIWTSITSSADGMKLAAVDGNYGYVYTSADGGVTWTEQTSAGAKSWNSIASSADGMNLAVTYSDSGYVYTLRKSQDVIDISITSPIANLLIDGGSWAPEVNWSLATNCYYSYDNFTSTSTANCALDGSDIDPPNTEGEQTLSIRAISYNGTIGNASVTFTYGSWTEQIGAGEGNWTSITSSADGTKLAATNNGGYIYTSTDGGVTWTEQTGASSRSWTSITSSADGTKLAATEVGGFIFTSIDSGVTWTEQMGSGAGNWISITSSADGTKLAAGVIGDYIYTSTDGGVTWTGQTSIGQGGWNSIDSSADGMSLITTNYYSGYIYTSTDGGVTWTEQTDAGARAWTSVTSSADGTKFTAVAQGEYIYTSTDGGITWIERTSAGARNWTSITSSADGTKLTAIANGDYVYTSTDGGVTWTEQTSAGARGWTSVTTSAYGDKIAVVGEITYIYTKSITNSYSVSVYMNQSISTWNPYVLWDSSETCFYSYDNFSTQTEVDCSQYGFDILLPNQAGESTLYVKGIDSQDTISIASSTFSIQGQYFCGTSDNDWANLSNWYDDDSCTIQSASVPTSQTPIVELKGTVSPIIESGDALPRLINSTGLTGPASTIGVIFSGSSINTSKIVGNATFQDTSYNTGTITGNVIYEEATGGTFTLSNTMKWAAGTIEGTILGGDSNPITNLIFNDSSSNEGTFSGTATFNELSSNNGSITGNVTFNGTTFRLGTVNGTATLNGFAQIIQGINTVVNLFKQLTASKDTLYLQAGSTLNVSGLFTLLGYDQNNLLTVRSTTPGTYANIGINGTADMNFLRLRDIRNTGSVLDLSSQTVFNDGHNSGFTFPSNSSSGNRGGITGNYTTPTLPPSRGGSTGGNTGGGDTGGGDTGGGNSGGGLLRNIVRGSIKPLNLTPLQDFNPLNPNFSAKNIGATIIPNPLQGLKAPGLINLVQLPTQFLTNISKFLFAPIPKTIDDALSSTPKLAAYITSAGVSREQDLAMLATNPVLLKNPLSDESTPPGLFIIYSGETQLNSYATYDKSAGGLAQLVKVSPNQSLRINLVPQSTGAVSATYLGQNIQFNQGQLFATTYIQTPSTGGRYILKSPSSPVPLLIEVAEPVKVEEVKKENIFIKVWKWLTS
ncbi:MAG: hypothetical protein RLY49_61 [Candidatus Parcubacteria bacterium]|jgi:photosystem II stability/assembly factor-like uncharacterized protein